MGKTILKLNYFDYFRSAYSKKKYIQYELNGTVLSYIYTIVTVIQNKKTPHKCIAKYPDCQKAQPIHNKINDDSPGNFKHRWNKIILGNIIKTTH